MSGRSDPLILSFITPKEGYKFPGLGISVRVDREPFNKFPVFDTVKFTIQGGKRIPLLEFKIPPKTSVYYYHPSRDIITSAEIIYSKSNKSKPLVYSITSGGNTSYYKQSNIKDNSFFLAIATRPSEDVADALIEENDKINNTITFRVDKRAMYNSIGRVISRDIRGNYKEYTHEPSTLRDYKKKNALVVNNIDGINEKVKFTGDSNIKIQDNKLDGFSVYFYDFGSHKDTPLMIKVKMGSEQHFYEPTLGHLETWTKVDADKDLKGGNDDNAIKAYLDKIKKWLCETVYVSIHKQDRYRMLTVDHPETASPVNKPPEAKGGKGTTLQGSDDNPSNKGKGKAGTKGHKAKKTTVTRPSRLNSKNTITVNKKTCRTELGNYVCFQHDLKVHKDPTQHAREEHEIGYGISKDIIVYISNVPINIHIVLPGGLVGYMGVRGVDMSEQKVNFTFIQKYTMLNVFFYSPIEGKTGEGMDLDKVATSGPDTNPKQKHDHIPLMFNYYKHWFKPRSIDEYFYVWDRVDGLTVPDPINCNSTEASNIKKHLDEVNMMLNRVKLNYNMNNSSMTGTATGTPSVVAYAVVNPGTTGNGFSKPGHDSRVRDVSGPQVIGNTTASSNQYGIPYPTYLNPSYNVNRIKVICQIFEDDKMFVSYTHNSINGFGIGTTCYRTKLMVRRGGRQADGQQGHSGVSFTSEQIKLFEEKSSYKYHTNLNSGLIKGVESDLDGKVDVTAKAVTVYFFNEDTDRNYPLLAEYFRPRNEHKYYVLKHCETAIS